MIEAILSLVLGFWLLYEFAQWVGGNPSTPQDDDILGLEEFEETYAAGNWVSASDMRRLSEAGYDSTEVEFMEPDELKSAMENAGVSTYKYDFEDTQVGDNSVDVDDMGLLRKAGYDSTDVEFMEPAQLKEAMEDAGVDLDKYDFEDVSDNGDFADTFVGNNLVSAEDMELLSNAGYDSIDVEFMDPSELKDAMEDAGVDTFFYDFDDQPNISTCVIINARDEQKIVLDVKAAKDLIQRV